jgi:hypothetical protein
MCLFWGDSERVKGEGDGVNMTEVLLHAHMETSK